MVIRFVRILHVFLVLGFILAEVSPACAFVSGKMSMLQICAADGSFKIIKVAKKYDPYAKKDQSQKIVKDCAFCFFQSHITKTSLDGHSIVAVIPASYRVEGAGTVVPLSLRHSLAQPRAPPVLS